MNKPDLYTLLKQFNAIGGMAEVGQPGFCLLMALWQKSNELNWAHQFTMTNAELLYKAGFNTVKNLIDVRNKLCQLGYFRYIKPTNRKKAGTYILNFNLLDLLNYSPKVNSQVNNEVNTIHYLPQVNRMVNSEVNSQVNSEVNSQVNSEVNINKLNKTKLNQTNDDEDDNKAGDSKPAPASAAGSCFRLFEGEFGRPLSPLEAEQIADLVDTYTEDLVREALRRAIAQGKRNIRYIQRILENWRNANLHSLAEILDYEQVVEKERSNKNAAVAAFYSRPLPDPDKVKVLQQKQKEEVLGAVAYIRYTLGKNPPRDAAIRLAQGYGELAGDILAELFREGEACNT
ncbi:DnaD domain-containing protein [Carboxydocella sp. ULO1]|uniref:DnaD domain-containing protein n=1 Tax=Carboxydocella sp. ULO1 TaxID=1926599 RepID=UPI0009AE37CA|nr:DnaD domain protein [Carboxydocella sp. ULO1]GAW29382.1 hypothetical protein ULO1_19520 [Carboxydocella sp. ULO1]